MGRGRIIAAGLGVLVAIAGIIGGNAISSSSEGDLAYAESQLLQMKNQVAAKQAGTTEAAKHVVNVVTGLNAARVAEDNTIAKNFMDWVFTWDTSEQYNTIRDELVGRYGCSRDGRFLANFMPKLQSNVDAEGNSYNLIDTLGYNMSYDDMSPIVCGIDGDTYSYFATVDVHSTNKYGDEGSGSVAFEYSIDGNGDLTVLDAYTISR